MPLSGSVETLSLADLTQVSAVSRRTCRVRVSDGDLTGEIYLDTGTLVHARFGDLVGEHALYAMLASRRVAFDVDDGQRTDSRSIFTDWQHLLMEAARLQDEGRVPEVRYRPTASSRSPTEESLFQHTEDVHLAPLASTAQPRSSWRWLVGAGLFVALLAGAVTAIRPRQAALPGSTAAAPRLGPLEASQLTGPGDEPPRLLQGTPPIAPSGALALAPTVVCRLLVSAEGKVSQARIYRSRLELAAFEDAALTAVSGWRFQPARHNDVPVAVNINWPVTFTSTSAATEVLHMKGSDTIGGALGPDLGRAYSAAHPNTRIEVEALGSATAFTGLFDGSAELGASSRPINDTELAEARRLGLTLHETVLGYDGIAVIVHPSNPVRALSLDELRRLFIGEISRWSQLGGADRGVHLFGRPSYSGTHAFFREKVLRRGNPKGTENFASNLDVIEKSQELVRRVSGDSTAIAYVGVGYVTSSVRALALAPAPGQRALMPERATILDGTYPIYRPLNLYTRGTAAGELAQFLRFVTSSAGRAIVAQHGFVPSDGPAEEIPKIGNTPEDHRAPQVMRIFFGRGSAKLDREATRLLSTLSQTLKSSERRALLIGNADTSGGAETSRHVARLRAERVAEFLVHAGVPPTRLEVQDASTDTPLASNVSDFGRSQNRRVDLFVLPPSGRMR